MRLKDFLKGFLCEGVSNNEINDAIDNHKYVVINYEGDDGTHNGKRMIQPVAFGCTSAGNPVIRAYEPFGDTKTAVPRWKFLRVDRISSWRETDKVFNEPAELFNPNGDKTMSVVYNIAKFDNSSQPLHTPSSSPKTKADEKPQVYKTDTEKRLEKLRKQLANPLTLSDFKTQQAFASQNTVKQTSGPKTNSDIKKGSDNVYTNDYNYNVFDDALSASGSKAKRNAHYYYQNRDHGRFAKGWITDTPKSNDNISDEIQLNNVEDLRKALGDTTQPISLKDLKDRLKKK
jgi:hypothetical protein